MESRRGARGSRSANFPPATAGTTPGAGGHGHPGRRSSARRGFRAQHLRVPGRNWGIGYPAAAVARIGGTKSPTWKAPTSPGAPRRAASWCYLPGGRGPRRGVARVSRGLLEARVLGASAAPSGPSPGGRYCLAGHWAWTRGKNKGGLRERERAGKGWVEGNARLAAADPAGG